MPEEVRLNAESGLYSERMLEMLMAREVIRAKRYPASIAIVLLAIRFKEIPSSEILESAQLQVANALHAKLREVDIPGHYQGNYLVVLPETDTEGARSAAQRLMQEIQGLKITRTDHLYELGFCSGVASHPGGPDLTAAELLSQASTALWEAQKRGPKAIVAFDEIGNNLQQQGQKDISDLNSPH